MIHKSSIDIIYVEKPTQYFSCLQTVLHLSCDGIPSQTLILPFSCIWENFMEVFILYCAQLTDVHWPLVEKDLPKMLPNYTINLMILIQYISGNKIEKSSRITSINLLWLIISCLVIYTCICQMMCCCNLITQYIIHCCSRKYYRYNVVGTLD